MAYRLENGEPLPDGIRRIATEQLSSAIKHLKSETGARDTHVHEARKNMKRLRGLIRLVRFELGREVFGRENECYRLAAAELAGMRDATILIETLDKLVRTADHPMRRDRFRTVRQWLVQRREMSYQEQPVAGTTVENVIDQLQEARQRVAQWPLQRGGWKGVEGGLRQVYGQGYKEFTQAFSSPGEEVFHNWRKRVKYLWYHMQVLRRIWPPMMETLISELDELGDLLGDDHDLAVLQHTVQSEIARPVRAATLQLLGELATARQDKLRARAHGIALRMYVEKPQDFAQRLRSYWRAWRTEYGVVVAFEEVAPEEIPELTTAESKVAAIRIGPVEPQEVVLLCRQMGLAEGLSHRRYAEMQYGDEGIYLITWDGDEPVGRLFVRRANNPEVPRIVEQFPQAARFAACPSICDVNVVAKRRSQGIGTQLLAQALEVAREWGAQEITLCVDQDNPRARSLYERLGFVESGIGLFTTSGVYVDEAGQERSWQNGPQAMLVKQLPNDSGPLLH
jgi:GNAT superfamily N-acetyltransferase/CHAD domain-containing protein